jgi:hypothetical protein
MVSRESTTNLSNMPAVSEEILGPNSDVSEDVRELVPGSEEKWKVTKFENTPPMSTYIVAIANGTFAHLETSVKMPLSGKTVPLRIYSQYQASPYSTRLTNLYFYSHLRRDPPGSVRFGCQGRSSPSLREDLQR